MENSYQNTYNPAPVTRKRSFFNFSKLSGRNYSFPKRGLLVLGLVVLVVLVGSLFGKNLFKGGNASPSAVLGSSDDKITLPDAKAQKDVNQEFSFPLKDDKGKEISRLKYVIETAEIRDQIIVKGQKASAVDGRTFLILNLKLVNEFTKPIEIKTSDYIRLSVNNNESEWIAPDMNNDPVSVQPISTKATRVGFPINETDQNIKLRVGEIEGEKQIVELNFN